MGVVTERRGRVLIVSMQREAKRNAIDRELADAIDGALNTLEDDDELWVGVLTGTPAVFSAGTDLSQSASPATERGGEYGVIRRPRMKPLIVAVEGYALGGGMEIVLAADLVVASTTARFGLPEVSRGLVPTCGGLFRSARALPLNVARELLLTGDPLTAERAERLGLVNRVTEPGGAVEEAVALAERICRNAPIAARQNLWALNQTVAADDAVGWEATATATSAVRATQDTREGVKAFFEKRTPQWQARPHSPFSLHRSEVRQRAKAQVTGRPCTSEPNPGPPRRRSRPRRHCPSSRRSPRPRCPTARTTLARENGEPGSRHSRRGPDPGRPARYGQSSGRNGGDGRRWQ
jgi:enoyl-CoA hydratase